MNIIRNCFSGSYCVSPLTSRQVPFVRKPAFLRSALPSIPHSRNFSLSVSKVQTANPQSIQIVRYVLAVLGLSTVCGVKFLSTQSSPEVSKKTLDGKKKRVERALERIKAFRAEQTFCSPQDIQKAEQFLKEASHRLEEGDDVPLPDFYHATYSFYEIMKSGHLKQFMRAYGRGAYVSTFDEGGQGGYGTYTFAIDRTAIQDAPAIYSENDFTAWACIARNIPIHEHSVPYVVFHPIHPGDEAEMERMSQITFKNSEKKVRVFSTSTSVVLRSVLKDFVKPKELCAPHWVLLGDVVKSEEAAAEADRFRDFPTIP